MAKKAYCQKAEKDQVGSFNWSACANQQYQKIADIDLVLTFGWDRARWRKQMSAVHNKGILWTGT
jgi:hypothetical protein